jgi:hypothetical protein
MTEAQPLIVTPPAVKPTAPVGAVPVTVARNVRRLPSVAGLAELVSPVLVATLPPPPLLLTTCDTGALADPPLALSPE